MAFFLAGAGVARNHAAPQVRRGEATRFCGANAAAGGEGCFHSKTAGLACRVGGKAAASCPIKSLLALFPRNFLGNITQERMAKKCGSFC
ncbi:MAG: hypothetical protein IKA46_00050 [Clostridia bacterium]|nr:hypothetical protein [Clostridia bacterium]